MESESAPAVRPTASQIDQTELVHQDTSLRHDFTLSHDVSCLDYQWFAMAQHEALSQDGHVVAHCCGAAWLGVPLAQ